MVSKDPSEKIKDIILGQSKDITYYTVCKKLEPIEYYEKELKNVRKKVREIVPEAQSSLEKLLDEMKKIDYSLISRNIIGEYGLLICPLTEIFNSGILEGIESTIHNKQENINNLKTALEYLASGDILEISFKSYLKRVEERFQNETGHTISWLAEIAYKIAKLLSARGFRNTNRNIEYLLNIKVKNASQYLATFSDVAWEESEKVANIVENLVKHPEQYKKDFEEYIEYKS